MNIVSQTLRQLSPKDFAAFGVNDLAYIKPVTANGQTGFAIHAADGTPLTVVDNLQVAFATVRQNDMEPVQLQ